ncbi:MAG: ATP-binding protein [Candidatus Woesearchaeota archaeon]
MITNEQIIETLDKWNFWKTPLETGITRSKYLDKLKLFLKTDEIVVVTGIRRSGKSTILYQLIKYLISEKDVNKLNTLYINFEDDSFYPYLDIKLLNQILEAYKKIINPKGKIYIIFDEIQKIEGWEHFVRSLYDRKENIKIFVTGSSATLLSSEFSTLLTGRHLTVHVYPLNFSEYLLFKGMKINLNTKNNKIGNSKIGLIRNKNKLIELSRQFLKEGGFPKVILTKNELIKNELLTSYFNDIIVKDIVHRYKIRDLPKIKNLALFYAANFCEPISFNSIKNMLNENSVETIERYSAFLESSYLIFFNRMFAYSLKKQMANERKVYFIDNGMRNAVAFQFKDMFGNLLENAVYLELLNNNEGDVFYHKDEKEVDFIIKKGLKINVLINACWDISKKENEEREIQSLLNAMEIYKQKKGYIITINQEKKIRIKEKIIEIIPFYKFCLNPP